MKRPLLPDEVGIPILRAFGFDEGTITRFVLTVEPGTYPLLEVTRLVTEDDMDTSIREVFEQYTLHKESELKL
jgi:hypothetical protein